MCVISPVVKGVVSESVCVLVYVVCVLVCGFGAVGALRNRGRSETHRDSCLSSLSCLSAGVFLAFCLLDIIPNFLSEMKETFTGLNITLCFPVPEFLVAVGFLLLLVMEQVILSLRDERERQRGQTEGREEKEALLVRCPAVRTPPPDPVLSSVCSSVLLLSLCLFFLVQGLSVDTVRPDVLLRSSLLTCSLVVLLLQSHMRRWAAAVCLLLLSLAFPLGLVLRHTHRSVHLSRCTLEGLSAGSFVYIVFMDIIPRATSANQHRIAKVTLILTGFSVFTAALLLKI